MKRLYISITLALLISLTLGAQSLVKLYTPADSLQYSLGAFVGQWLINNSFTISNKALFNRGMDDIIQNHPLAISDSSILPILASYQLSTQNERSRQLEAQLFAELKGKTGVGALPNGVHYIVIEKGSGIRPTAKDTVVFNAVGVFPDGTVFEDSFKKGQPIINITSNLIPGLNEAMQLMPEGSKWRIFIPSALGYGTAGLPNLIPPNTALVFDITLNEVKK
ncbi:MAG: FKBP-type peptidyl-prolyl cis-trans isomerase [Bacteroidales bacterium]|nr:FKBP-type peptidyl-prolyl cis-trans isomerase [Bacteroidales bacterium]